MKREMCFMWGYASPIKSKIMILPWCLNIHC